MSAPIELRYRCASELCKAEFSLNSHERYSKARAHCPACGSLWIDVLHNQKPVTVLAGTHRSVTVPSTDRRLGVPALHAPARTRKHKRMEEAMSAPTRYRAVALKNNYERFKAKRAKAQKKAERLRREKDWAPLK